MSENTEKIQSQLDKYVALQKELADYKKNLEGKTKEELNSIEQELIKETDAANDKIQKSEFKLQKSNYVETCKAITMLSNKISVQWQQVQMMLDIYNTWDEASTPKKITYKNLDATLRQLGQLTFTGIDELTACDLINKYMEESGLKEAYLEATEKLYFMAEKHNAVMQALEAIEGQENLASPVAANRN